eukprot:6193642-Pleurochrysis_carterae.AAC.2
MDIAICAKDNLADVVRLGEADKWRAELRRSVSLLTFEAIPRMHSPSSTRLLDVSRRQRSLLLACHRGSGPHAQSPPPRALLPTPPLTPRSTAGTRRAARARSAQQRRGARRSSSRSATACRRRLQKRAWARGRGRPIAALAARFAALLLIGATGSKSHIRVKGESDRRYSLTGRTSD